MISIRQYHIRIDSIVLERAKRKWSLYYASASLLDSPGKFTDSHKYNASVVTNAEPDGRQ